MKKGYWVVSYRAISDESALKAYVALAAPAIEAAGGRLLTSGMSRVHAHESGVPMLTILVQFDSYEKALTAYETEAYQKSLQALGSTADRDLRIVEGG